MAPKVGYEASTVAVSQNVPAFGRTRSVSGLCAPNGPENTKTWYVFLPESIDTTGKLNGLDEAGMCCLQNSCSRLSVISFSKEIEDLVRIIQPDEIVDGSKSWC